MSKKSATKSKGKSREDEKVIKEIIRKYGDVIDLKETPYVLIEILRNYRLRLTPDDGGLPPGGTPTPPSPGPAIQVIDLRAIMNELLALSRQVKAIKKRLDA